MSGSGPDTRHDHQQNAEGRERRNVVMECRIAARYLMIEGLGIVLVKEAFLVFNAKERQPWYPTTIGSTEENSLSDVMDFL